MLEEPYRNGRSSTHSPPFDPVMGILLDQSFQQIHALGRIESKLENHSDRLTLIERRPKAMSKIHDLMPFLYGLVILAAAAAGRIKWDAAITLLQKSG